MKGMVQCQKCGVVYSSEVFGDACPFCVKPFKIFKKGIHGRIKPTGGKKNETTNSAK